MADFVHVAANQNLSVADRKAGILLTLMPSALLFLLELHGLAPLHQWSALAAIVWALMMISL